MKSFDISVPWIIQAKWGTVVNRIQRKEWMSSWWGRWLSNCEPKTPVVEVRTKRARPGVGPDRAELKAGE